MTIIDNAKDAWRHYSTIALAALTGLGGSWASIPDEVKAGLPHWAHSLVSWMIFAVAAFGLGGKFIKQKDGDAAQ